MSLSIGIVGLPNVGKSTLFNALVKTNQAQVSNYPFCTIEPNVGIVEVPDDRLAHIADRLSLEKKIPAPLKFIDIAGLVKGAHKGEGLGNKFLSHIQECDAIAMVIRAFENKDIALSESSLDPTKDAAILTDELILKDLEMIEKQIESAQTEIKSGDKLANERLAVLKIIHQNLEEEKSARSAGLDNIQRELIRNLPLLTLKPIMYIINISENQLTNQPKVDLPGPVIYLSAKTEADLIDFSLEEAREYLDSLGLKKSILEQIIIEGYKLLDLITFYTLKTDQIQAWPIPAETPAPKAAGMIHSDFEKGFIKAEVIKYDDLISAGSISSARQSGTLNFVGKDYLIQDGDIVQFKFKKA